MRSYGQFCPIARGAEIFAERWTPVIIRNLAVGCTTFGEILDGAPGLSRTLLSRRLGQLERFGIIESSPKESGRGRRYTLTASGEDLARVGDALGEWGAPGCSRTAGTTTCRPSSYQATCRSSSSSLLSHP